MPESTKTPSIIIVAILLVLTTAITNTPAASEPSPGHLPVWEEGFAWSYEVDHDVDYDLGFIKVNHIKENWTRVVDQVLDVEGEKVYKVWESRRGTLKGTVTYIVTIAVTANAVGTGWTFIRAADMAIINQTFDLTFSGNLPLGGSFSGGFDNTSTYDPPMPLMEFPVPSTEWRVRSTVNTTTEFYITSPDTNSTWYNTSEVWDLNVTATGPSALTVPAGTYDSFTVHEVGTRSNATETWPVDRSWHYADEATNIVRTFEGHELVWTDAVYTPPNSPPEGPATTVLLSTDEDVPLEVDLSDHFSDPDEDALNYGLQLVGASGGNATLTGAGAVRTVVPKANWSGVLDLRATASDPFGQEATGDLEVTVAAVNDPPYLLWQPHDLVTEEDTPLRAAHDLADVFADVDGDDLDLSANSTPGVVALMNGTMVDLLPELDWTGRATVTLVAEDPYGERAVTEFDLLVGEVNDPPTIVASGGPARIHETEQGVFWIEVVDTDSDELEYTWSVEGLVDASVSGTTFTYVPGDLTGSTVTVAVRVEDEWNDGADMSWEVTVLDSPSIVSSDPPSPVSAEVGETVTFTVDVEDADTPEPNFQWTWNGDLVGSGQVLPMLFGARDVGEGTVRVVVDDGVGNDSEEWSVTVEVPNEAPTVEIVAPLDGANVTLGEPLTLRAVVDDEDLEGLDVRWSVDGTDLGEGLELQYTPTTEGQVVFQVTAFDGELTATDSITINVLKGGTTEGTEDTFPWGTVFAIVLILVIVVLVVVYSVTRGPR